MINLLIQNGLIFQDKQLITLELFYQSFLGGVLILTLGLMAVSTGAGVLIWVMVGVVVSGAFGLFATKLSTGVSVVVYLICAGGLLLWKITGGRK